MIIEFKGKLSNWDTIRETLLDIVGRPELETVSEFEAAIRNVGIDKVNAALIERGHEARVMEA